MKKLKNLKNEIKNFWNFLSNDKKIFWILSLIWTIFIIIFIMFLIKDNKNLSIIVTLIISYLPISNIFSYVEKYLENRNDIKLIHFYSKNIINIYEYRIKPIIDKNPNLLKYETVVINSIDAMSLKTELLAIKRGLNQINNNGLFSYEEKRCMYILNARINEFLNKTNIPDMKEGEVYVGEPFEIDWRNLQWFIAIPNLLYEKTEENKACFYDIYKKYYFEDLT